MAIKTPELGDVGGFGFAADQTAKAARTDTSMIGMFDKVSSFAQKFVQQRSQEDGAEFMQGVIDQVGGTVKEQSIFTPDSYMQGQQYAKVTDELSAGTTGLYAAGIEAATAGTPEAQAQYQQKVSDLVGQMNRSIQEKGLTGEALQLAQKQILNTATNAMVVYQKEFDLQQTRLGAVTNAKQSNIMIQNIKANNYDQASMAAFIKDKFDAAHLVASNDKNDKDPVSTAGKQVVEAAQQDLSIANPQTPEGQRIIAGWHKFAQTEQALALGTAYNDLSATVVKKTKEMQDHNSAVIGMEHSKLERAVDAGQQPLTRDGYTALRNDLFGKVNNATISTQDGLTRLNELNNIEAKQYKDEVSNAVLLSPDRAVRAAHGVNADSAAVNAWYKQFGPAFPTDTARSAAMIQWGVTSTNPEMITAGAKEVVPAIETLLSIPPDQFDKVATVQQKQVWSGFINSFKETQLKSPGLAYKMLDAFSPDMRAAVDAVLDEQYAGRNAGADMRIMQSVIEQRKNAVAAGGFAGSFTGSFKFSPDDIKSSIWGRFAPTWLGGEGAGIRAQNYVLEPNEEGRQYLTNQLNLAMQGPARDYLVKQERQGRLINSPSQVVDALIQGKFILPLETGAASVNPIWYQKVQDGFKTRFGYGLKDSDISSTISTMQDDYFNKLSNAGLRDFDREDVQATVVGDIVTIRAYKNGSPAPYEVQKWGISRVHERAWNLLQQRADVAAPPITGSVMHGKQSMDLTPDWDRTFTGGLKQHIAQSLLQHEGSTMQTHTPDKGRPNLQTIGMGVNISGDMAKEPLRAAVIAAHKSGNKAAIDKATGAFIADYYKGFPKLVASAGLPPMEKSNTVNGTAAYVALANAHYQSPLAGTEYAKLLQVAKTDPAKAKQMFRSSAAYIDINKASGGKAEKNARVKLYDSGFDAQFRIQAQNSWQLRKFGKSLIELPYPTLASGEAGFRSTTPPFKPTGRDVNTIVSDAVIQATTQPTYPLLTSGPQGFPK